MDKTFLVRRCAATVLVLAMAPGLAQAYIDPGSGAYMVQAAFALVAAVIFYARHPVQSLRAFGRWITGRWRKDSSTAAAIETQNDGVAPEHEPGAGEV